MELHRLRIKGCPIEVDELLLPAETFIDHELVTFGDNSEEKRDAEGEECVLSLPDIVLCW